MSTINNSYKVIDDISLEDRDGLGYIRVSSPKQEKEGHGRESQEARCRKELLSLGVKYVKTFADTVTGGGDFMNRPAMRDLLNHIDSHPHKKFVVIFDDLKRFARDTEFHLKLRAAFRKRDVKLLCLNFSFDESPEGRFVEVVMAGQAELERHQNQRQVVQKMKARLEAGYWPFGKKKGYDIVYDPLHGKIGKVNGEGLILKDCLEAFSRGEYGHKIDFIRALHERGFWKGKYPEPYLNKVDGLLTDPYYVGDIEYPRWEVARREGKHKGLISREVHNNIQERLKRKSAPMRIRRDIRDDLPARGFINCICTKHITAAWSKSGTKKKPYAYYFCTNKECTLYKKSIPAKAVEDWFNEILKATKIKEEVGNLMTLVFDRVWKQEIAYAVQKENIVMSRLKNLNQEVGDLMEMVRKAKNETLKSAYEEQLEKVLHGIKEEEQKLVRDTDMFIPYRTALEKSTQLLKDPYSVWQKMEMIEKHDLFFFIFDEKLIYDSTNSYRTADIPTAVRLFETFVATNSSYVDPRRIELLTSGVQNRRSTK